MNANPLSKFAYLIAIIFTFSMSATSVAVNRDEVTMEKTRSSNNNAQSESGKNTEKRPFLTCREICDSNLKTNLRNCDAMRVENLKEDSRYVKELIVPAIVNSCKSYANAAWSYCVGVCDMFIE